MALFASICLQSCAGRFASVEANRSKSTGAMATGESASPDGAPGYFIEAIDRPRIFGPPPWIRSGTLMAGMMSNCWRVLIQSWSARGKPNRNRGNTKSPPHPPSKKIPQPLSFGPPNLIFRGWCYCFSKLRAPGFAKR